jgi:VacB/RNase II family 3'-5' exoribonuclease
MSRVSIPASSSASTAFRIRIPRKPLTRRVVSERPSKSATSAVVPDFRTTTTVTIDGEHARDFDDAITIERLPNGHYWLGVHIADVSHYVRDGSALDEEAYERGTSVYFTERAVHMFPAELATGLCSLNPHVDRLVQSCLMEVDARGTVVRYEMHDGVINSDARMTYTAVNAILTDRDPETIREYESLVPMFELMHELFAILHQRRRRPRIDRLRSAGSGSHPLGVRPDREHRRNGAQRRAPDHRGVHAVGERNGGGPPRRQ